MRAPECATLLMATVAAVAPALAQDVVARPDSGTSGTSGRRAVWWAGGALVAGAALADVRLEHVSLAHRSATLDALARTGDALGVGRHLVPALAATYVAGRLARAPRVADATVHTAVAYALGNVAVSLGKPALGRHRPDTTGSPWRFHPFASAGAWHSLPSGHTLHAFTLAGALAEETHRPWVTVATYGAATLVGWSRVYADEHWASDVAASAVLGAAIGHATVRHVHARSRSEHPHFQVTPSLGGFTVVRGW